MEIIQPAELSRPATANLEGTQNITEISKREGFQSSTDYAIQFAGALCNGDSLDVMRERFAALTGAAGVMSPDNATAEEIGRHYLILDALFRKMLIQSVKAQDGRRGSNEAAERLMNGAFKAQRACMACLNALKVIRDGQAAPTQTTVLVPNLSQTLSGADC